MKKLLILLVVLGLFVQFRQCLRKKVQNEVEQSTIPQELYAFQVPQYGCTDEYVRELLRLLNGFRAQHQAPPLKLSSKASIFAQSLANTAEQHFKPDNPYGYSFSYYRKVFKSGSEKTVQLFPSSIITELWKASDVYGPSFGSEPDDFNSGDVLKLARTIWKDTSRVGFGCTVRKYADKIYAYVVIANEPLTISIGQFGDNVLQPVALEEFSDKEYEFAAPSLGCSVEFKLRLLYLINQFRAQHGTPPLRLSESTSNSVQAWTQYEVYGETQPDESTSPYVGELIYETKVNKTRNWVNVFPDVVFDEWTNAHADYVRHYGTELDEQTLNDQSYFTRLLWKDSNKLGLGCVTYPTTDDKIVSVVKASVLPYGNQNGGYKVNVLPPV